LDTIDKVSQAEMVNVAITAATTSLFLAAADARDLIALRRLLDMAREARMLTERTNRATPEILEAWQRWYDEAVTSLDRLRN
jgi:hypothetical protein